MYPTCRVCLTNSGVLLNIFTKERETFPSLAFMINTCVEVKVKPRDKLPKHICKICLADVQAAFRFKRNYELTLKQFSKRNGASNIDDLSDQENISENVMESESTSSRAVKMKRALALGYQLTTAKKTKTKESENKESPNEERQSEDRDSKENDNEEDNDKDKSYLEETSDGTESAKSDKEKEQRDLSTSESQSVGEEEATTNNESLLTELTYSDKIFVCDICNKGFKKKEHLKRHTLTHTSERPFKCEWCSEDFRFKTSLKKHLKTHRKEKVKATANGRPYPCKYCSQAYNWKSNLRRHMKKHKKQ